MNSSIGNFSFLSMEGPRPNGFRRGTETIDRRYVDGLGWRQTAYKNTSIQKMTTAGFSTLNAAEQAEAAYAALINTYVTLITPNGVVWANVLVESVEVTEEVQFTPICSEPGCNYLVKAVWTLRRSA